MKTKPFNMEAALNGAPVVTRSGRKVFDLGFDTYPICAKIDCGYHQYDEDTFTVSGRKYDALESPDDLFMLDEEGGEDEN